MHCCLNFVGPSLGGKKWRSIRWPIEVSFSAPITVGTVLPTTAVKDANIASANSSWHTSKDVFLDTVPTTLPWFVLLYQSAVASGFINIFLSLGLSSNRLIVSATSDDPKAFVKTGSLHKDSAIAIFGLLTLFENQKEDLMSFHDSVSSCDANTCSRCSRLWLLGRCVFWYSTIILMTSGMQVW